MIDNRNIHPNHSAGSKIEMSDFGVSHHAFGKTDARAVRGEQSLRILLAEFVVERLGGHRDRVAFARRRMAPAVDDYEREWPLFLIQRSSLTFRGGPPPPSRALAPPQTNTGQFGFR